MVLKLTNREPHTVFVLILQFFLAVVIQEAERTQCLSTAPSGQESMSDISVIRDILCLVLQSEDACLAVNGVEMQYSVRI